MCEIKWGNEKSTSSTGDDDEDFWDNAVELDKTVDEKLARIKGTKEEDAKQGQDARVRDWLNRRMGAMKMEESKPDTNLDNDGDGKGKHEYGKFQFKGAGSAVGMIASLNNRIKNDWSTAFAGFMAFRSILHCVHTNGTLNSWVSNSVFRLRELVEVDWP